MVADFFIVTLSLFGDCEAFALFSGLTLGDLEATNIGVSFAIRVTNWSVISRARLVAVIIRYWPAAWSRSDDCENFPRFARFAICHFESAVVSMRGSFVVTNRSVFLSAHAVAVIIATLAAFTTFATAGYLEILTHFFGVALRGFKDAKIGVSGADRIADWIQIQWARLIAVVFWFIWASPLTDYSQILPLFSGFTLLNFKCAVVRMSRAL